MSKRFRKIFKLSRRTDHPTSHSSGQSTPDRRSSDQPTTDPRTSGQYTPNQQRITDPYGGQLIPQATSGGHPGPYSSIQPTAELRSGRRTPDPRSSDQGGQRTLDPVLSGQSNPTSRFSRQPSFNPNFGDQPTLGPSSNDEPTPNQRRINTERILEFTPSGQSALVSGQAIANGIYTITNVRHCRFVYLEDPNDTTPLRGHFKPGNRNAQWYVRSWGNEEYSIQNVEYNRYAYCGPLAGLNASVEGYSTEQLWRIQALPTGEYTIATTDTKNLWMLPYGDPGTPVELFNVHTDRRCWWTFKSADPVNENLPTQAVPFDPRLPLVHQDLTTEKSDVLKRLSAVEAANYDEDHSCMEGTRTTILDDIIAWVACPLDDETQSNRSNSSVFWLYSMPGLGKTSVANSLCDRLRRTENLGGCFFCKHDNADLREPKRVLPTLIAKLGQMWSPFRKLVAKVLLDEPHINPESTRGELLLKPLQLLKEHPPRSLVLVIDALDECGVPNARGPLLDCLIKACSLVNWLKIVVTSRPEADIKSFFDRHRITSQDLAADDLEGKDIRLFTERRMASVARRRHLSPNWPSAERVGQIVERSRGLFIFVDTLSRLVDIPKPEPLLVRVLNGKLEEANAELHKLYSTVITSRAVGNIEDLQSILRAVIVVSAYRPLCAETLAKLIDLELPTILSWLDELSSLLYQDAVAANGIRVRHLSILEFLVGSTCPPKFRVEQKLANSELTRYCLLTMANELHFNICGLETACLSNADIPDLNDRVRRRIPDSLQYSCMHWASHLCYDADPVSAEITGLLGGFFAESQPLYWIEVLSLMGKVPVAISSVRLMKGCFKKFEDHHQRLVEDAWRFLLAFFAPISTSTPHLYVSALPFMPIESDLWKHASISFPEIIDVCKGRVESWPAPSSKWRGHTGEILCIAYSPDGLTVVSGSGDKTIRIWDAQTGALVGNPLTGHTEAVSSVAYSPDGWNVVSGSSDKTIRIWDAQTGAPVGQPLTGHTGAVRSVAYSPDGRNVVSSSSDKTIRIWDAQTWAPVGQQLIGHTGAIWSVAYSPDGRNVASGSDDNTIRIWDAQTGAPVGRPLTGQTKTVWSVAYSPDGRNVASGSYDKTIRIWDAQTGAPVGKPLTGHTGRVWSVAYSPDGRNVASGSYDKTIRIWDAQTGAPVGKPLTGHTEAVLSVAYSPDGRNVISGSSDETIRIWDAQTGAPVGQLLTGHTEAVSSVAYSPDGRNVISGSEDETVRIWDAQTGAPVGQPLTGHTETVLSVAYSPDGRNVISGSSDETIRIWDAQTGAPVGQLLTGHTGAGPSVAYSPDGQNVVSGSFHNKARIWDAQTGAPVGQPLTGHTDWVQSVAYSPDCQNVVSGSDDKTIRIWDAQTGAPVVMPLRGHTKAVLSVAYSPDGRNVISGSSDETIRIWDAQTGTPVGRPLIGHTDYVRSVAYSPDGRNIVSGSADKTIRIWEAQTGAPVGRPLTGHTGSVWSVAYSLDGRNVVSGSSDKTIRVWDAHTGMDEAGHGMVSHSNHPTSNQLSLTAFSGRPIPTAYLGQDGWVRGAEGLLFWVPEDCRHGLTCPAITTIPHTGRHRTVRIDFTHSHFGASWTNIRGGIQEANRSRSSSL